jgi:ABC-type lipoprotein export system ATPase subunit
MPAGPVTAVSNLSFTIAAGDHVAVRGPSGCGKSTLLHMLGCVDAPTSGRLLFDGQDVATLSDAKRSRVRLLSVGFVFQRFFLLPMLTAAENVELPQAEAGVATAVRQQRTRELLDLAQGRIIVRRNCRAARCSAWRSREPCPTGRGCCWPTSPRANWIRPPATRSRACWTA